jgi:hypothetical protein
MTLLECEKALKQFEKTHDLNKTITIYTDDIDQAVNELLRLEQTHKQLTTLSPGPAPSVPAAPVVYRASNAHRRIVTPNGTYANLETAVREMGVKKHTLQNYLSNRSDKYYYAKD